MKRNFGIVVLAATLSGPSLGGDFYSGNDLFDACKRSEGFGDGLCFGIVAGVVGSRDESVFCVPSRVKATQAVDVVKLWLHNHPERRHLSATSLVTDALKEKFPCN